MSEFSAFDSSEHPRVLRFRCPRCMRRLKSSSKRSGQTIRCPACFFDLVVPYESTRKKVKESDLYQIDEKPIDNRDLQERNPYASFLCPICATILSIFSESEIGTTLVCPECQTSTVVPESVTRLTTQQNIQQQLGLQGNRFLNSLNSEQELVISPTGNSGDIYGVSDPNTQQYYAGTPDFNAIFDDGSFGVYCPLCNTLLTTTEEMVGQKLTCPDCGTETMVQMPKKIDTTPFQTSHFEGRALYDTQDEGADTFRLKEPLVPVICSLCETRMYAPVSQIGHWKTCPDCETKTLIKDVPKEERILPETTGSEYTIKEQPDFKRPTFRVGADYRKVEGSIDLDNKRYRQEQEKKRLEREKKRFEREEQENAVKRNKEKRNKDQTKKG